MVACKGLPLTAQSGRPPTASCLPRCPPQAAHSLLSALTHDGTQRKAGQRIAINHTSTLLCRACHQSYQHIVHPLRRLPQPRVVLDQVWLGTVLHEVVQHVGTEVLDEAALACLALKQGQQVRGTVVRGKTPSWGQSTGQEATDKDI
jgi:hypothetical protein